MATHDTPIPRLDEETLVLYRRVLEMDRLDAAALEREFGPDSARRVLRKLVEARLVRPLPDDDGMTILRPDVAASAMIDPLETTVRDTQRHIERISGQFDHLMAVYLAARERRNRQNGVLDTITDPDAANALVAAHVAAARKEVLVMCGTGPTADRRFAPILSVDAASAPAGVRLCVLHQHSARYHQAVQDHAAIITGAGGQVRTIERLWGHTCVIDQEIVFIYDRTGVVSVSQLAVAASVAVLFEQIWSMAKPFDGRAVSRSEGRELSGDVKLAILYFLAEGLRDERIARQVGVSVRTCRRHIAEVLEQLGATSRFQAGYLTAQHRILEPSR